MRWWLFSWIEVPTVVHRAEIVDVELLFSDLYIGFRKHHTNEWNHFSQCSQMVAPTKRRAASHKSHAAKKRCRHTFTNPPQDLTRKVWEFKENMDTLTNSQEVRWMHEHAVTINEPLGSKRVTMVWDFDPNRKRVLVNLDHSQEPVWLPWNDAVRSRVNRHDPAFVISNLGTLTFDHRRLCVDVHWSNISHESHCVPCLFEKLKN